MDSHQARASTAKSKAEAKAQAQAKAKAKAKVMDDTLTILSTEPMRMVSKLNRKSQRALEKSGHHNVPRRKQEVLGVVHIARLCVIC